jgi:methionyl-tRNA formyltransferase
MILQSALQSLDAVNRYRGAAPIYHAMLNDEKETGVSVIELDPDRFDAGKILLQKKHVRYRKRDA